MAVLWARSARRPQAAKLPCVLRTRSKTCPLIRPSVRTGAPSPQGEGFGGESSPSSGPSGHLPPRGKALVGNRPLTRPFGPPSPQGEGFGGESPPHPALRATFPPGGRFWWGIVPSPGPSGHLPPRGKALVGNCPPHPALRATFPPGGRLWWGTVPLIRPFGPPSPEGEGLQAAKGRPCKSPRRRDTPKTKIRPSPQTGTTYWRL